MLLAGLRQQAYSDFDSDGPGRVAVVQNGIIENCRTLREELRAEVVVFRSDTDMEVIPHLLSRELAGGRCRTIPA